MEILAVFHDNDIHSGATKSFLSNLKYFKYNKNYNICAIVPNKNGELKNYLNTLGIEVYTCLYGGNVYSSSKEYRLYNYMRCLFKTILSYISCLKVCYIILKKRPIDIVYSNTSTIYYGAWISYILKRKHIWHFREFCYEDQKTIRIFKRHFNKLVNKSYKIIMISNTLEEYYRVRYNIYNTYVLYNDIDKNYILKNKIDHKHFNILITGTLCEEKGQLIAIKAQKILNEKNVHLYIAGRENKYGNFLKNYVNKNNIKNIHFCGLVKDMNELRRKMDISVVCSKKEAFGRTVIEDMLSNIVVIGSNSGAIPELIKNKENGLIFEKNDVQDLVSKIKYCLKNDLTEIRYKAFQFAKTFTYDTTANSLSKIFEEEIK